MDEFNAAVELYKRKGVLPELSFIMYALYKQATIGPCPQEERPLPTYRRGNRCLSLCKTPTRFDFTRVYRWEAWRNLGNMSQDKACQLYARIMMSLE